MLTKKDRAFLICSLGAALVIIQSVPGMIARSSGFASPSTATDATDVGRNDPSDAVARELKGRPASVSAPVMHAVCRKSLLDWSGHISSCARRRCNALIMFDPH